MVPPDLWSHPHVADIAVTGSISWAALISLLTSVCLVVAGWLQVRSQHRTNQKQDQRNEGQDYVNEVHAKELEELKNGK